jgi:hypothetical protein
MLLRIVINIISMLAQFRLALLLGAGKTLPAESVYV